MAYKIIYRVDNQCDSSYLVEDVSTLNQALKVFAHYCYATGIKPVGFGLWYFHINNSGKVSKRTFNSSHIFKFWNEYDNLRMAYTSYHFASIMEKVKNEAL